MYTVWKNAKCIAMYKTYKRAYVRFLTLCEKSDEEKDCIEMYSNDYLLHFQ